MRFDVFTAAFRDLAPCSLRALVMEAVSAPVSFKEPTTRHSIQKTVILPLASCACIVLSSLIKKRISITFVLK
jgi:hypothetical protein